LLNGICLIEGRAGIKTEYPAVNEDLFEYISFLEAIIDAKKNFAMIELGALSVRIWQRD